MTNETKNEVVLVTEDKALTKNDLETYASKIQEALPKIGNDIAKELSPKGFIVKLEGKTLIISKKKGSEEKIGNKDTTSNPNVSARTWLEIMSTGLSIINAGGAPNEIVGNAMFTAVTLRLGTLHRFGFVGRTPLAGFPMFVFAIQIQRLN
jgi:hypothetical protein